MTVVNLDYPLACIGVLPTVYRTECAACGYEVDAAPARCPKCGGSAFERYPQFVDIRRHNKRQVRKFKGTA